MSKQIKMPKLGMSEKDLQVVKWYKKAGDKIEEGEPIVQVEADKITHDIEATEDAVLKEILVEEGETAAIGTQLAVVVGLDEENSTEAEEKPVEQKVEKAEVGSEKIQYEEKKLLGMRKRIFETMSESFHNSVPVVMMRSVDITKLKEIRDSKKEEYKAKNIKFPSYNDFIMKATALALRDHPKLNSTYEDNTIRLYKDINISFALALEEGLITPVIKNVDKLSVWEINSKIKELSQKANNQKLEEKDMENGTFTVTNLGMKDIEVSTPILNPPQVAILAVGTIKPYLVMEAGQVKERFETYLSLTLDHRIVDGAPGADFLMTLAQIIEEANFDLSIPENISSELEK